MVGLGGGRENQNKAKQFQQNLQAGADLGNVQLNDILKPIHTGFYTNHIN